MHLVLLSVMHLWVRNPLFIPLNLMHPPRASGKADHTYAASSARNGPTLHRGIAALCRGMRRHSGPVSRRALPTALTSVMPHLMHRASPSCPFFSPPTPPQPSQHHGVCNDPARDPQDRPRLRPEGHRVLADDPGPCRRARADGHRRLQLGADRRRARPDWRPRLLRALLCGCRRRRVAHRPRPQRRGVDGQASARLRRARHHDAHVSLCGEFLPGQRGGAALHAFSG